MTTAMQVNQFHFHRLVLDRPLIVLDCETTGVSPEADRIVELGLVKVFPDGAVETRVRRLNPGIPIPEEATRIHGIADDDVVDCPAFAAVARSLAESLAGCDIAGFGVDRFDLAFLEAEFDRAGVPFDLSTVRVLDALQIFHKHEPRDLAAAVRHYLAMDLEDAHTALADAVAALRVLDAQIAEYGLPTTVSALAEAFSDPARVDRAGKFMRRDDGATVINFGKHRGLPLCDVPSDYLAWLLKQDFRPDVKRFVRKALETRMARKEEES